MRKIYAKNFSIAHALTLIFIRKSLFSKPIASVFSPQQIIFFFYGAETCPPLVQLIGHVSALIGYIEMFFITHVVFSLFRVNKRKLK